MSGLRFWVRVSMLPEHLTVGVFRVPAASAASGNLTEVQTDGYIQTGGGLAAPVLTGPPGVRSVPLRTEPEIGAGGLSFKLAKHRGPGPLRIHLFQAGKE